MRRDDRSRMRAQRVGRTGRLPLEHVESGAAQATVVESGREGGGIHQLAPGDVDQAGALGSAAISAAPTTPVV